MNAWPIEDVWLRPIATVALAALVPWALERGVAKLLGRADAGPARRLLFPAEALSAWLLGVTALGPALVASRGALPSVGFAGACALLALGVGAVLRGVHRHSSFALGASVAAAVVLGSLSPDAGPIPAWALAGVLPVAAAAGVAWREAAGPSDGLALGAGLAAAVLALGSLALPWALTDLDVAGAPNAGTEASRWRLRVDPWDEAAMLGAAWASRQRGESARAIAQAREARRMGLAAAPALELEAEVHASRGDCGAARDAFDAALRARAASAFDEEGTLTAPLTLGGYHLPPSLVTECGGLDQLPGVGDAAGSLGAPSLRLP